MTDKTLFIAITDELQKLLDDAYQAGQKTTQAQTVAIEALSSVTREPMKLKTAIYRAAINDELKAYAALGVYIMFRWRDAELASLLMPKFDPPGPTGNNGPDDSGI